MKTYNVKVKKTAEKDIDSSLIFFLISYPLREHIVIWM